MKDTIKSFVKLLKKERSFKLYSAAVLEVRCRSPAVVPDHVMLTVGARIRR